MRIATFNINGVNTRLSNLLERASDHAPTWIELR
jgi:exonuclease III